MDHKKIKQIEKKVLIVEAFLVAGIFIYLFFSTAPNQIYPLSGMTILEPDFVFEIQNGEQVLISIDKEFTNPLILGEGSDVTLPPALYFWKVKSNFRESEIKNFTIKGHVGLNIKPRALNYELQNTGNVELNITRENSGITSGIILDVGESKEFEKDDSYYEGAQK